MCHETRLPHCPFVSVTVWSRLPIHARYLVSTCQGDHRYRTQVAFTKLHHHSSIASPYIHLSFPFGCSSYNLYLRYIYRQIQLLTTSTTHPESQACLYITSSHFGASTSSATFLRRSIKTIIAHEANNCHHHGGLVLVRFAAR